MDSCHTGVDRVVVEVVDRSAAVDKVQAAHSWPVDWPAGKRLAELGSY